MQELARGATLRDLRARLTKENDGNETMELSTPKENTIPDELVQIQAFIRWEKAGKPNYSAEEQLVTSNTLSAINAYKLFVWDCLFSPLPLNTKYLLCIHRYAISLLILLVCSQSFFLEGI